MNKKMNSLNVSDTKEEETDVGYEDKDNKRPLPRSQISDIFMDYIFRHYFVFLMKV